MKDGLPDDICLIGNGKNGAWTATGGTKKPYVTWRFASEGDLHRLHKATTWSLDMDVRSRLFEAYRFDGDTGELLSHGTAAQLKALLPPKEIAAAIVATLIKSE